MKKLSAKQAEFKLVSWAIRTSQNHALLDDARRERVQAIMCYGYPSNEVIDAVHESLAKPYQSVSQWLRIGYKPRLPA